MGYGSETSERASRIDLAVVGVATVSVAFYLTYDVPLAVTSVTMFGYMMFVHQPSVRECVMTIVLSIVNAFFREIGTRGRHNVPPTGPLVFVIAPHANQMLDPLVVIETCGRSEDIGFLAAAKTVNSAQFGWLARALGSIPVERPQDLAIKRGGTITSAGSKVTGVGTDFTKLGSRASVMASGEIVAIKEVISSTELVLNGAFHKDAVEPVSWKEVPHVDQENVYSAVYNHLAHGNAFGIFPEGGSHDRPDLLPLKAGAAIMTLGAMVAHPEISVKIIPVGLNYFGGDRFRSRIYVDYGRPIEVTPEQVEQFKAGGTSKREVVGELMDSIKEELDARTLTAESIDILKVVWCARRLYLPVNHRPEPKELLRISHTFLEGFKLSKDQPVIQDMVARIEKYNNALEAYALHDHQVGKIPDSTQRAETQFVNRLWLLFVYLVVGIPGGIIWCPLVIISKHVSRKKKEEALAGSIVKIEGKDVVGTWKVMTVSVCMPLLLLAYSIVVGLYFWSLNAVFLFLYIMVPSLYVSMRSYEQVPRLYRSVMALWTVVRDRTDGKELKKMRDELKVLVRKIVDEDLTNTRQEVAPDFDLARTHELRKRYSIAGTGAQPTPAQPQAKKDE